MNYLSKYSGMAFLLAITVAFTITGCKHEELRRNACNNCVSTKPSIGNLHILFTHSEIHSAIPYQIFEGTYESGTMIYFDTAYTPSVIVTLSTDVVYTVAAEYNVEEGKKLVVINTDKIKARRQGCSENDDGEVTHYCWFVIPGSVDLKIRE